MRRTDRGFTHRELVIVLGAVVGLLLVLMLGLLGWGKLQVRRICAHNLKSLALSSLMYSGDYGGYFPNINSHSLGSGPARFGNWQPLGSMQYSAETNNMIWACPAASVPWSNANLSNYRYIGSGIKDDNDSATVVTLGYDASGNHGGNRWMNASFIDGHVEGARPDGSRPVTYNIPGGTKTSAWNLNHW